MRIIGISHLDTSPSHHDDTVPASALEAELALVWEAVLERTGVGSGDHFFELGGNSLGVARVAARLSEHYGVQIPLTVLFRTPTLKGMAAALASVLRSPTNLALPPLKADPELGTAQLSLSQERMWLLHQLDADGTAYSVAGAARLQGALSDEAVEASLRDVVTRHEALRTVFLSEDGQLIQRVVPNDFALERVDLRPSSAEAMQDELTRRLRASVGRPFDFEHGPMFRASLFHLGKDDHLLLLDLPHVNSDAWSVGVLIREFLQGYEAYRSEKPLTLPPLPVQYRDYARWQRSWLQGEVLDRLRAYWWPQVDGLNALDLPLDHPRPPVLTFAGATVSCAFPSQLLTDLRRLARQEDATLFMLLLAAFKVLLMRWSGSEDVAVGTPVAGRHTPGIEDLVGVFVNTLVMRTDLSGQPTFRETLSRVKDTATLAFGHQDMPFAQLVADLQPARDLSRSPLVQVMFNQINVPMPEHHLPGLRMSFIELDRGGAQFDLSCTVTEIAGNERLTLEYNTALFERESVVALLGRFVRLLEGVARNPDTPIWHLPLLSRVERAEVLAWSGEARPADTQTVHGLFELQARRTPDAPALRFRNQEMNYGELNARANRLARRLVALGVRPGDRVAVYLPRSPQSVASILAVLKAGGSYVPLDPAQPPARLALLLRDADPSALLTETTLEGRLHTGSVPVVHVDGVDTTDPADDLALSSEPQAAYLLYTSGSTGAPKGVVGTHQGVLYRLAWMWEAYPFRKGEVCCHKTSPGFVDSVWELFGPLLAGVPVVLVPDEVVKDPPALIDLLAREEVSRLVLVPSLLRVLLEALEPNPFLLPRLWLWSSSGEALSWELAALFRRTLPHATLLNLYGSTEVAADATWFEVSAAALAARPAEQASVPAGQPIPGAQVYVVDAQLGLVPPGTPGELLISGLGLAPEYHRQPELTAERFPASPFGAGHVFRTHDRGVLRPDGALHLLGRTDRQVKIRGVRVEPEEVEALLLEHPLVRQCAVMLLPRREPVLAAYVVPTGPLDAAELRAYLAERMAAPAVPGAFVMLDDLPKTASGKLDRLRLPAVQTTDGVDRISPRTPEEERMAALWAELLDRSPSSIGVHDSFFDLGGHSLLAARLIARIEPAFGHRVPLAALFQRPTVAGLSLYLESATDTSAPSHVVAFNAGGDRPPLFCLPGIGGHMSSMRELALALGPAYPLYGLEAVGVEGREAPLERVEAMAARYLQEIRRLQPRGPYYLCGHSFGGLIAYELAQRLQQAGEEIGLLVLLDTWTPRPEAISPALLARALWRRATEESRGLAHPSEYAWKNVRRLRTALRLLARRGADPSEDGLPDWFRKVRRSGLRAASRYRARPLDAPVLLMRAEQRKLIEPLFAWDDLLRRPLDVAFVGGTHITMIEAAHVQAVGALLVARLQAVQKSGGEERTQRGAEYRTSDGPSGAGAV